MRDYYPVTYEVNDMKLHLAIYTISLFMFGREIQKKDYTAGMSFARWANRILARQTIAPL
jgi:hypothetical protein